MRKERKREKEERSAKVKVDPSGSVYGNDCRPRTEVNKKKIYG
jgi:hypothetical protein